MSSIWTRKANWILAWPYLSAVYLALFEPVSSFYINSVDGIAMQNPVNLNFITHLFCRRIGHADEPTLWLCGICWDRRWLWVEIPKRSRKNNVQQSAKLHRCYQCTIRTVAKWRDWQKGTPNFYASYSVKGVLNIHLCSRWSWSLTFWTIKFAITVTEWNAADVAHRCSVHRLDVWRTCVSTAGHRTTLLRAKNTTSQWRKRAASTDRDPLQCAGEHAPSGGWTDRWLAGWLNPVEYFLVSSVAITSGLCWIFTSAKAFFLLYCVLYSITCVLRSKIPRRRPAATLFNHARPFPQILLAVCFWPHSLYTHF